ncbi:MAG: NADH-quinone oxidoreductase subunit H [Coriobacteriales bacterium]|nr:NADH-quinone oxidoreductase subunit H [Coriobacteriales bacterium]
MSLLSFAAALVGFGVLAPVLGCLLSGADRIVSARMQGRVGPPLLQPLHDVRKLLAKDVRPVNSFQGFYVLLALLFSLLAGAFFFAGGSLLLVVFVLTLSTLFFVVAAYSTRSPFAEIGAEREIIQVASYEPMVILFAVSFFIATGSFDVSVALAREVPVIAQLPLVFCALLFILTIKLRKSPFDLSYSHHAHQELVKGITTEMSGRTLALVEVMHWYENVLFLGWVALFVVWSSWIAVPVALAAVLAVYFFEVLIDNNFARVKWQSMFKWSWAVTLVLCLANILVLSFL